MNVPFISAHSRSWGGRESGIVPIYVPPKAYFQFRPPNQLYHRYEEILLASSCIET